MVRFYQNIYFKLTAIFSKNKGLSNLSRELISTNKDPQLILSNRTLVCIYLCLMFILFQVNTCGILTFRASSFVYVLYPFWGVMAYLFLWCFSLCGNFSLRNLRLYVPAVLNLFHCFPDLGVPSFLRFPIELWSCCSHQVHQCTFHVVFCFITCLVASVVFLSVLFCIIWIFVR